jgi:hypothetical protein
MFKPLKFGKRKAGADFYIKKAEDLANQLDSLPPNSPSYYACKLKFVYNTVMSASKVFREQL